MFDDPCDPDNRCNDQATYGTGPHFTASSKTRITSYEERFYQAPGSGDPSEGNLSSEITVIDSQSHRYTCGTVVINGCICAVGSHVFTAVVSGRVYLGAFFGWQPTSKVITFEYVCFEGPPAEGRWLGNWAGSVPSPTSSSETNGCNGGSRSSSNAAGQSSEQSFTLSGGQSCV